MRPQYCDHVLGKINRDCRHHRHSAARSLTSKSFLVLFFKKELLPSLRRLMRGQSREVNDLAYRRIHRQQLNRLLHAE